MKRENKLYFIIIDKRGNKYLRTYNPALAKAIAFTTEQYYFMFDSTEEGKEGKKVYSFEWNPRLQDITEELVRLHEESLKMKKGDR